MDSILRTSLLDPAWFAGRKLPVPGVYGAFPIPP